MFTNIRLKNYKSLVDVDVNLLEKKNKAKNMIILYGENGSGKTNFAESFSTLYFSLKTLSLTKRIDELIEKKDLLKEFNYNENIYRFINEYFVDTERIINDCRTIDSEGNMILEFGFIRNEKKGIYTLEYDKSEISHEKLDFAIGKKIVNVFDISGNGIKINSKLFINTEYEKECKIIIEKYRGKHSLLAILFSEIENNAKDYVKKRINRDIFNLIMWISQMTLKIKKQRTEKGIYCVPNVIYTRPLKGTINKKDESELDKLEKILNVFFTCLYSDIKKVYFKKERKKNDIYYHLYAEKLIFGEKKEINFEFESTGTRNLSEVLPCLLMAVEGNVVVIDEIDTGIHDILISELLSDVIDKIKGQLIITTHNTMVMESDVDVGSLYLIDVDSNSKKQFVTIKDYERNHPNQNIRGRYLKGMYNGIPYVQSIDFENLHDTMVGGENDEED